MAAEFAPNRVGTPDKHAAVPHIGAFDQELLSGVTRGLLDELRHTEDSMAVDPLAILTRPNIAITGFRMGRLNTDGDQTVQRLSHNCGHLEHPQKLGLVTDEMVGR